MFPIARVIRVILFEADEVRAEDRLIRRISNPNKGARSRCTYRQQSRRYVHNHNEAQDFKHFRVSLTLPRKVSQSCALSLI